MTMTPAALLDLARGRGVVVEAKGPKLRVVAPDDLPEREWVAFRSALVEHKAEVLALLAADPPATPAPPWPELAPLRWGPAEGDPRGGIVVDEPDRSRMLAAMEAIRDEPGDVTGFVDPRHLSDQSSPETHP